MAKVFQILVPDNTLVSRIISCENQVNSNSNYGGFSTISNQAGFGSFIIEPNYVLYKPTPISVKIA